MAAVALAAVGVVQHGHEEVPAQSGLQEAAAARAAVEVPVEAAAADDHVISWQAVRTARPRRLTRSSAVVEQVVSMEAAAASMEVVGGLSVVAADLLVPEVVLPGQETQCTCTGHIRRRRRRTYPERVVELVVAEVLPEVHPSKVCLGAAVAVGAEQREAEAEEQKA